jgi:hypothetical protein
MRARNLRKEMKKMYQVRWYEYNLTNERHRNFFTEIGAQVFRLWLLWKRKEKSLIYVRDEN